MSKLSEERVVAILQSNHYHSFSRSEAVAIVRVLQKHGYEITKALALTAAESKQNG